MLRKSKIFDCLKRKCQHVSLQQIVDGYEGVSALEIAELLVMDRANVSKELNHLHQEKRIIKVIGRPVYYFDVEVMEELLHTVLTRFEVSSLLELRKNDEVLNKDEFSRLIGCEGSLKTIIKKAKAAMIYPPFGLHTLLVGPTGVGKTMFAEIMFTYAKEYGVLQEDASFIVFNCAEYADNPQLLLGQLFGHVKGAYTGAEKSSDGLVEKAKNGVLFLDEIHRLPPEGQEMLFMLMDRGEYRKLGSNENCETKVLIIAATTENLESSLLHTFLRRIPMTINMPALEERTLKERFELIEKFFHQEYNQVRIPIRVQNKIMKALLSYDCKGNIGQLKADIRLLCANGFLDYKVKNHKEIRISTSNVQDYIYHGLLKMDRQKEIDEFLTFESDDILYDKTMSLENYDRSFSNIYKEINELFEKEDSNGKANSNTKIRHYIEQYMKTLSDQIYEQEEDNMLHKIIPIHIYHAVEIACSLAQQRLGYQISKKVIVAMALHVSALSEHMNGKYELNPNIYNVLKENPKEYQAAREMKNFLDGELEIKLKDEELIFFTMFLCIEKEKEIKTDSIAVLALAHGNGVARNMMDVANSLLNTRHGHALDMSLHQNVDDFLEVVIAKVKEIDEGKGVLLLVDMGSLLSFEDIILKRTQIAVKTIDMVSTPFVLEAVRKAMLSEYTLEDLYKELRSYTPYIGKLYSKELREKSSNSYVIVTTCMTGEGAAIKLGDLIRSAIPLIKEYHIEIIPCNASSFPQKDITNKRILAVVGACDLHLKDIAYISSDKIILEDGLARMQQIIEMNIGVESRGPVPANLVSNNFLKETLVFLDPMKADEVIRSSFRVLNKMVEIEDYNRVLIGYMLHVGCMVERCIRGEDMPYKDVEKRIEENENLYRMVKTGIHIIEDNFQVVIPDTEVAYVMDIFDTD